jgi:hypothetical protein
MSTDTAAPPETPKQAGLPRYYLITALVVAMIIAGAGGLITYRVAVDALIERVNDENMAFADQIDSLAETAAKGFDVSAKLQSKIKAEMARRPVVLVRVYDKDWRIQFSTNSSEVGDLIPNPDRRYSYDRQDQNLAHYAVLDTGAERLNDRELIVTKRSVTNQYWETAPGFDIYTDVTTEVRNMIRTDAIVVGGIELVLAVLLVLALLRKT